jgi:hypothetical protein
MMEQCFSTCVKFQITLPFFFGESWFAKNVRNKVILLFQQDRTLSVGGPACCDFHASQITQALGDHFASLLEIIHQLGKNVLGTIPVSCLGNYSSTHFPIMGFPLHSMS